MEEWLDQGYAFNILIAFSKKDFSGLHIFSIFVFLHTQLTYSYQITRELIRNK